MRSHFEGAGKSELEVLRKELAEVKKQNKLLRARLECAERASTLIRLRGTADVDQWINEMWRMRGSHAVERSSVIRKHSAGLIEMSQHIREPRSMQREQTLKLFQPSFMN